MRLDRLIKLSFDLINIPTTTNKHFTFLLLRNNIISYGWSQQKTSPLAIKRGYYWGYLHSELSAIKRCPLKPDEFYRLTLVNTRVNTLGKVCNSKPCPTCTNLLRALEFKNIIFTNEQGEFDESF